MIAKVKRMNEFRCMMQRVLKSKWQEYWAFWCLVSLFIGLLLSRAVVSFASVFICIPFLFHFRKIDVNKKVIWGITLMLLPILISGIWSDHKDIWWNCVSNKLPFYTLFLGIPFAYSDMNGWRRLVYLYMIIITGGCCWSIFQYLQEPAVIEASYLKAKVIPTLSDGDYVRFSWMVVISILLGIKAYCNETGLMVKRLVLFLIILQIAFLHLLATKTGLLCLYSSGMIYLFYVISLQRKWKQGLIIIFAIVAIATLAYISLPTLRNRIQYVAYDLSLYGKGNAAPGYNDAARWASIKAGIQITNDHPITGVGFGDILDAIDQWHVQYSPESLAYERFRPANEWLVYGAGSGWPGIICFSIGLFLIIYTVTKKNIVSVIITLTSLIPLLTDDTLEGQYGVVLLAFIAFFGQERFIEPPIPS